MDDLAKAGSYDPTFGGQLGSYHTESESLRGFRDRWEWIPQNLHKYYTEQTMLMIGDLEVDSSKVFWGLGFSVPFIRTPGDPTHSSRYRILKWGSASLENA